MAQFSYLNTLLLQWLPLITTIPILTTITTILFLINTAIASQLCADSSELDKGAETVSCVVSLTPKNSNSSGMFPNGVVAPEVAVASDDYSKRKEIKENTARVQRWTPD